MEDSASPPFPREGVYHPENRLLFHPKFHGADLCNAPRDVLRGKLICCSFDTKYKLVL